MLRTGIKNIKCRTNRGKKKRRVSKLGLEGHALKRSPVINKMPQGTVAEMHIITVEKMPKSICKSYKVTERQKSLQPHKNSNNTYCKISNQCKKKSQCVIDFQYQKFSEHQDETKYQCYIRIQNIITSISENFRTS